MLFRSNALMQAVTQLGVRYINHTDIVSWHKNNNRITTIESSTGEKYTADAFVITAGAWTGQILTSVAITVPVKPIKGQMILYKLPEQKLKQIKL